MPGDDGTRWVRVPIGIEKVLCRAAGDEAFRAALLADREAALAWYGYELSATERATLLGVPDDLLRAMVRRVDLGQQANRPFLRGVAAVAFAAAALSSEPGCTREPPPSGPSVQSPSITADIRPQALPPAPAVHDEGTWVVPVAPPGTKGARPMSTKEYENVLQMAKEYEEALREQERRRDAAPDPGPEVVAPTPAEIPVPAPAHPATRGMTNRIR